MLILVANLGSTSFKFKLLDMQRDGEVIELGSHDELIARRGRYFSLYDDWRQTA